MRKPFTQTKGRSFDRAHRWSRRLLLPTLSVFAALTSFAAEPNLSEEVRLLREQNALLQKQLTQQGSALDELTKKVKDLETAAKTSDNATDENGVPTKSGFNLGKVNISAEGGVAFFNTGNHGFAPHSEFRVDEARIFLEAPIWDDVYFFSSIDLATRENTGLSTQLGELYLDFENVSQLWGKDSQLNIRAGRINIPFGEEYLTRYAMENPLISHSVADFWGIDPGVELYGRLGKFSYVAAVQNGGVSGVQDFNGDKSVTARLSYDPNPHWHFSVSGMRTGNLDANKDYLSAVWFGNGWFRSVGSTNTTAFHVNAVQGDVTARWKSGYVGLAGGYLRYEDNDSAANNQRGAYYYSAEVVQQLPKKFFVATRFSEIIAEQGLPVVGLGNFDEFFYGDLTKELWRWSFGVGYRFSDRLVLKTEYSLEQGKGLNSSRPVENFFGTEAAFKF